MEKDAKKQCAESERFENMKRSAVAFQKEVKRRQRLAGRRYHVSSEGEAEQCLIKEIKSIFE